MEDVKNNWKKLGQEERQQLKQKAICCDEDLSWNLPGVNTVRCGFCNSLFHCESIQFDNELAFICTAFCFKSCILANFKGLVNFLHTWLRYLHRM